MHGLNLHSHHMLCESTLFLLECFINALSLFLFIDNIFDPVSIVLGSSHMSWKERKKIEDKNVLSLGGKVRLSLDLSPAVKSLSVLSYYIKHFKVLVHFNSLQRSKKSHLTSQRPP